MKFVREEREGVRMLRLCDDEYNYSEGYYAANNWLDDDHILLARTKDGLDFSHAEYVLVDLKNETETVLITDYQGHRQNTQGYVKDGVLYFFVGRDLVAQNLMTGERRTVLSDERAQFSKVLPDGICMTTDGRYLSAQAICEDYRPIEMWVIDTQTGDFDKQLLSPFAPPFWMVTHVMVCPSDPERVFWCHEGTTQYVSNRLWVWEKGKGSRLLVKQRLSEDGNLRDCLGHESWAADGKGLYYVKYPVGGEPPYGIGYVGMDDALDAPNILFSKYRYWHVCASPDGKKLAADTIERHSGVCVIDLVSGEERCLLHVGGPDRSHPTHPHPCFSPSGQRLSFHDYREVDGKLHSLGIGIIDL